MSWTTHKPTESMLTRLGADFIYEQNLAMADLAPAWDKNNASRSGAPIISDAVENYSARIEGGEMPPAVIAIMRSDNSIFPVDGRQRLTSAKRAGWSEFNAYLLAEETSRQTIETIEISANACLNGTAGCDAKHVITQVVRMHLEYGTSIKQLSADTTMTVKSLQTELVYQQQLKYLSGLGVPVESWNKGVIIALDKLPKLWWKEAKDEMEQICSIFKEAKIVNGTACEYIDRIAGLKKKNPTAQLRSIKREMLSDSIIAAKLKGKSKQSAAVKVIGAARHLRTAALAAKRAKISLDAREQKELVDAVSEARSYLKHVCAQGALV